MAALQKILAHHVKPLIKDTEETKESDSEDSFNLQTLGLALCMVRSGTTSMDPSHLIKAADTTLLNCHAAPVLPLEISPNPNVYPISSSVVYPCSNVIDISFDEVLNVVFPIN